MTVVDAYTMPAELEIPSMPRFDFYAFLGLVRVMEPETELLMRQRAQRLLVEDDYDSPHTRPWFVSYHGSEMPEPPEDACSRYLAYRMMNFPSTEAMPPWVTTTGVIGKAGELDIADAWYQGGRMLAIPESANDHAERLAMVAQLMRASRFEEAIDLAEKPGYHQLGFVDRDHWMTVSTDLPILPKGWHRPHIVEIKCLAGDTRVLTEDSGSLTIRQIAQNAGGFELLNGKGEWQWCPVKSFGIQETYEIKLKRGNETKSIRATGDHRWFVDKTPPGEKHAVSTEITTVGLGTGDKLTYRAPYSKIKKGGNTRPSPFGIARGIVYGDGTTKRSGGGSTVDLFGEKDAQLLRYFDGCKQSTLGNGGVRVADLPAYFKTDLPYMDDGVSYLYGWLAGYFAADGTVSKNGSCYLDCAKREPLAYVERLCLFLGIPTRTIYEFETGDRTTPQGNEYPSRIAYRICIPAHGLTEDFFLIDEHRQRWLGRGKETPAKRKDRWEVVDVVHGGLEEVFCAVVEGTQQFVLDGYILTGNCKADDVLDEMIEGRLIQFPDGRIQKIGRGPDKKHTVQLKATIGKAHDFDWGEVTVCSACWGILYADIFELLTWNGAAGQRLNPAIKNKWAFDDSLCPFCDMQAPQETFKLGQPTTGEVYYWSRSWPRKTKSFYYEHDEAFMRRGLEVLARTREDYIEDRIPERPEHFQWSVGPCQNCSFKKFCRLDSGLPPKARKVRPDMVRTKLTESAGVEHTQAMRPHYDPHAVRQRVFQEWEHE